MMAADDELAQDSITPSSDVFSYFMMTAPSEKKQHKRFTPDACMSYMLVIFTLFMQGVLLFCVYNKVIVRNTRWTASIMNTGKDWNIIGAKGACNDGSALCTLDNGTFTCAPPSVQLIGRWDDLDTNQDGIWTRGEVMNARADLTCKFGVDPVEVFDVILVLLKLRESIIWLHPEVKKGTSIQKVYFTYIMGDIAMCGYRNEDMCGNLLQRGFFDAPLKHGNIPRIGNTINSALDYCHDLLKPEGFCERVLPSTYSTWKIESVQECKDPEFNKFVYKDPNGGRKSLLAVDYDARQHLEVAKTPIFLTYKSCIIFMWLLLIISQMREVGKAIAWVSQIDAQPDTEPEDEEAAPAGGRPGLQKQRSVLRNDEVHKIHWRHRCMLVIITFVRLCMLVLLLYIGLMFLARQTDYIGLLLDGVALIFIVEVEEILYARVLRAEVRTAWEEREPLEILTKMGLPGMKNRADLADIAWFILIMALSVSFLVYYTAVVVTPLYEALECACLSQGSMCREADTFSNGFWNQYWQHDVPGSIQGIGDLKKGIHAQNFPMPPSVHLLKNISKNVTKDAGLLAVHLLKQVSHHLH